MKKRIQLLYGGLLSLAGVIMIIAFQPKTLITDAQHYQFRILSEMLFLLFAVIYTNRDKLIQSFALFWFLLSAFACYDDWFGCPYELSFSELSVSAIAIILFYYSILATWKHLK